LKELTVTATGAWLGAMVFLAFVVAPAAFGTLDRQSAGDLMASVFPAYYRTGLLLGGLALAGVLARWRREASGWARAAMLAGMLALTAWSLVVVLPEAQAARVALAAARGRGEPGSEEGSRFARAHRLSGALNGVVIVTGLVVIVAEAARGRRRGRA
jgi:uncharacterized membrane protein